MIICSFNLCCLFYYLLASSNIFKTCWLITTKPEKDKRKDGINFVLGLCEQTRKKGKSHTVEKSASGISPSLYIKQSSQSSSLKHKSRGKKCSHECNCSLNHLFKCLLCSLLQITDICCAICNPLELYPFKRLLFRIA